MKKAILLIAALVLGTFAFSQSLTQVGSWEYGPTEAVAVKDSTAYISSGSYLWVLDISDESNISLVDEIKLSNYITFIKNVGNYLFISGEDSILDIYDIHNIYNPVLSNSLYESDELRWFYECYLEGDTIYICGHMTYQYFLNDTVNPIFIRNAGFGETYDKEGTLSIITDENYVAVYDLSASGDVNSFTDYFIGDEDTRSVVLRSPYGYFGYGSRGIGIMDISNIYSIDLHSTVNTNGYTYDIELIEDTIMIAARGLNGIGIYDVENDTTFTLIGECDTDGYAYELEIIGNKLYIGAKSGGLIIVDISDKSNPTVVGEYQGYGECRRMDIDGDRLYSASGDGGLMIMDITNRTSPTVIGETCQESCVK